MVFRRAEDSISKQVTPVEFTGHTTVAISPKGEIDRDLLPAILRAARAPWPKILLPRDESDVEGGPIRMLVFLRDVPGPRVI